MIILCKIRFADRDIVMRYHWGLGIGHTYSHGKDLRSQQYLENLPIHTLEDVPEADVESAGQNSELEKGSDVDSPMADIEPIGQNSELEGQGSDISDPVAGGPEADVPEAEIEFIEPNSEPEGQDSDIDGTDSELSSSESDSTEDDAQYNSDEIDSDCLDMYDTYGSD